MTSRLPVIGCLVLVGLELTNCRSDQPDLGTPRGGMSGSTGQALAGSSGSLEAQAGHAGADVEEPPAGTGPGGDTPVAGSPGAVAGRPNQVAGGAGNDSGGAGSGGTGGTVSGSGGAGRSGDTSVGGTAGTAGGTAGTAGGTAVSQLGQGQYQGSGTTVVRFTEADVTRNGVGYKFIANGWGSNWLSHDIAWNGTSFTLNALSGSQGLDSSPAGYPSMFCGSYSQRQSGACGLPASISSLKSLKTGWRWKANGNTGQYNAAWDIWLGTSGSNPSSYLMVWLRDPPGQQPAGSATAANVTVAGLSGTWKVWTGTVVGRPIVNYVTPEGSDRSELEFDVLDVVKDAIQRGYSLPGSTLLSVAVGFEVWNGPIADLASEDFYVEASPG